MTVSVTDVHVAGAPAIPGLRFRRYAGLADVPALVEVRNAAYLADGLDDVVAPETLASELAHAEPGRWVPEQDLVVVEIDGRVVGWSQRDIRVESASGARILAHRGLLIPEVRRHGIGTALFRHNEAALVARAAAAPAPGAVLLDTWTAAGMAGANALCEREGYRPVRYFFDMVRPTLDDLPEATLPDGLEIRAVTTTDEALRVLRATDEAFRDHWGHVPATAQDDRRYLEDPRQDIGLWQVAWDADQVAGVTLPLIDETDNARFGRWRGWLDAIAVRRPWRRRGVARALIVAGLRALRDRGLESAILGVDTENETGALGLYERTGFVVSARFTVWRKEVPPPGVG